MRCAIMDIGYNAIRAVVYESNKLGAPEIFNNKFKNDILSLLSNESLDIKHQTYLSIQYFLHVFKKLAVAEIKCVATAVLREHPRAGDFIDYVKGKYGFDINIISGEEEARLTAQGLMSGIADTNGIAADLGGGSLELVEVQSGVVGKLESLALGTKVISSKNITSKNEITKILKEKFNTQCHYKNLYLIGGALRFIGRLYIDFTEYPIKNLHNLEITHESFSSYLAKIKSSSANVKSKLGKKRLNNNAILVAEAMLEVFNPEKIIISTYGLKEGVRVELLDPADRLKDIVEEKVSYACNYDLAKTNFNSYFDILKPTIDSPEHYREVLKLAIILSSLKHRFDKTLPPKAISEYILASEIPFKHRTRLMLALVLAYSSNYKPEQDLLKLAKKILTKEEHASCQIIGHFLQIAEEIDGPNFSTPSFSIKVKNLYLEIEWDGILPRPTFEKVCARLKSIAYARKIYSN
ncbi:MAG: Ppx/GppA phosphatase family protein [Rickettsiaceae bacterium]